MMYTQREKLVADYASISIFETGDICIYDYCVLLRDAIINMCSETSEGREYLKNCWIEAQTEPDREGLQELMRKHHKGG